MTTMLFTDPRFRSPSALGALGVAFCDSLNIALNELANVLERANAAGLYEEPVVVGAQAIYDDRSSYAVYVGFLGDACAKDTAEVAATAERVRSLLRSHGIDAPVLRPDYVPPEEGLALWMKVGGGLLLATVSVVAVAYIFGQGATIAKLFKGSRRLSRYRRRR